MRDEAARTMVAELLAAGWRELRHDGRHTMYGCTCGRHSIPVPTTHRTISAGVVRKIRQAIAACKSQEG